MTNFGFITVASAIPNVNIANCQENANEILQLIEKASAGNVQCICFPELSITGYTCADLFNQKALMDNALKALQHIQNATAQSDMLIMVGLPISHRGSLYNFAAILQNGEILAIVPKTYLPNHNQFYDNRM